MDIFSLCTFLLVVLSFTDVVGFTANVIQFGMDQLQDSQGASSYTGSASSLDSWLGT